MVITNFYFCDFKFMNFFIDSICQANENQSFIFKIFNVIYMVFETIKT